MESVTLTDIDLARSLILKNAERLIEEAELLYTHGYYARSYTLAHLSLEEMSKIHLLLHTGIELASGREIDWKSIKKRFADHKFKIGEAIVTVFIASMLDETVAEEDVLVSALSMISELNKKKNDSLYVSFNEGKFVSPEDAITQRETETINSLAELAFFYHKAQDKILGLISEMPSQFWEGEKEEGSDSYIERIVQIKQSVVTREIMKDLWQAMEKED